MSSWIPDSRYLPTILVSMTFKGNRGVQMVGITYISQMIKTILDSYRIGIGKKGLSMESCECCGKPLQYVPAWLLCRWVYVDIIDRHTGLKNREFCSVSDAHDVYSRRGSGRLMDTDEYLKYQAMLQSR
jgi:hypothetical protein